MSWARRITVGLLLVVTLFLLALAAWAVAIGPEAMWRVLTHGTTTVWDHLEYPGRTTMPAPQARPWTTTPGTDPTVTLSGEAQPVGSVLAEHDSLAMVVVHEGSVVYEWYAPDHGEAQPSMLFSVTKSITSLLVGAAVDDGLIGSVDDPVTDYVPELASGGFGIVTIADLLQMRSNSTYVEDDNPFGMHVEFNYTADLEADILGLAVRDEPHEQFTYKSGDNAILGLILHRVLAPESVTAYLQRRLLDPLGAEDPGIWSTDDSGGLERTWCCLALTARDLARLGQLILDRGEVDGESLLPATWLDASFTAAYAATEWPADYQESALVNYGYQWWLTDTAVAGIGKDGQYLFVDPTQNLVIVRTGTSRGGIGWLDLITEIAEQFPPDPG